MSKGHKQTRVRSASYTDPREQPSVEEIERATVCQCGRPSPVREELPTSTLGVKQYVISCLRCGRTIK